MCMAEIGLNYRTSMSINDWSFGLRAKYFITQMTAPLSRCSWGGCLTRPVNDCLGGQHVTGLKHEKAHATEALLVLVLLLIGQGSVTMFLTTYHRMK